MTEGKGEGATSPPTFTYDMSMAPASFDFVTWLGVCSTAAQGPWDLQVLPGPNQGFRQDDLPPQDIEMRRQFFDNVMLPAIRMFPVRHLSVYPADPLPRTMPNYMVSDLQQAKPIVGLTVPEWALRTVRTVYSEPFVTITTREASHWSIRNSNMEEWRKVAKAMEAKGFRVVWLRDAEKEIGPGFSVIMRAALYECAHMNFGVSNGPMMLAYLNPKARYIVSKIIADTPVTSQQWMSRLGLAYGDDWPWSLPGQKLLWTEDRADSVLKTYDEVRGDYPKGAFPAWMPDALFRSRVNVGKDGLRERVAANLERTDVSWIGPEFRLPETVLIVGGAPSVADNLRDIRARQKRGAAVIALSGAHDWLISKRIVPDYMMMLDARPGNADFVQKPHARVRYLIASQCDDQVFKTLAEKGVPPDRIVMWHVYDPDIVDIYEGKVGESRPFLLIGGGNTVGLRAMYFAPQFGARTLHIYGMDSSYREKANHAFAQPLNDGEEQMEFIAGKKAFICAPWMAKQAEDYQHQLVGLWQTGVSVHVHGDGLIPHIHREMCRKRKSIDEEKARAA
ncbi:6-hydroxymethylpterin diphosphokinase MptE-like protein [Marinibaculum pumilum]|uniref:6-hydroxymethylpterin diphosphokinase MptE-like protein n=1 Tax=Marinibaculum pumilum TaxID=1766165 RepID=A0ABV7L2G2_9PROT